MKTKTLILILVGLVNLYSIGQTQHSLTGGVFDSKDTAMLFTVRVDLLQKDSLIQRTFSGTEGKFEFNNLKPGEYQIKCQYFNYSSSNRKVTVPTSSQPAILLTQPNDTFPSDYLSDSVLTMYYYGSPAFSDDFLSEIGEQYGVQYSNISCMVSNSIDRHRELVVEIISRRHGSNWENQFWKEVKEKNKTRTPNTR